MIDSDNVLLLREAWLDRFAAIMPRLPPGATSDSQALVVVTTYALVNPVDAAFVAFFRDTWRRARRPTARSCWRPS